jgi:DNA polymerase I-like protein with 3'-5' exonuclease and polymerase domains
MLLYHYLDQRIQRICPELYDTERALMLVCVDMELTGLMVDLTRAHELRRRAKRDMRRIMREMERLVCPLTFKRKKKGQEVRETVDKFNPNSSSLQLPAAFRKLGIELKFKTKPKKGKKHGAKSGGGNWSFDEYAMVRYVSRPLASIIRASGEESWPASKFFKRVKRAIKKHRLPKRELLPPLVLKYRQLKKMVSTYYDNILAMAVDRRTLPDGREVGIIHCSFNQSEAMTGRFSSSKPNLQNMPRLLGPRECFIPRPKRRNWHLDYEQIEMKMFVHFARDEKMAAAIADDIHRAVAAELYERPPEKITKEQRKRAKGTNFGILYGSGPRKQAETLTKRGLPTTVMEATQLVASYHRKFPSVRQTTNDMKARLVRNGSVANPYGRRYHIPSKFAYKILNYMCQGTSADIIKKAMVELWRWLRDNDMQSKIILTNHDELGIECPKREERRVITKALEIMEDLEGWFVPITVSADVVTERWSEKRDPAEIGCQWLKAT